MSFYLSLYLLFIVVCRFGPNHNLYYKCLYTIWLLLSQIGNSQKTMLYRSLENNSFLFLPIYLVCKLSASFTKDKTLFKSNTINYGVRRMQY